MTVVLSMTAPSHAASIVEKRWIQCVVDHVDVYKEIDKDPVMIFLELCPTATPTPAEIASITQNALPSISRRFGESAIKRVLVLRQRELDCLARYGEKLLTPAAPEHLDPQLAEREWVSLDLSICGKSLGS